MLREINAAAENNTASHQLSNSSLTIKKMPPKEYLLSELNAARQPDTDRSSAGVKNQDSILNNFINYLA